MRHTWVFDVLKDLMAYAQKNDLPALAAKVAEVMAVAEVEIKAEGDGSARMPGGAGGRTSRAH